MCNKLAGNFIRDCNMFKSNCKIDYLTLADVSDTRDSNPHRLLKKNICCDSLIVKKLGKYTIRGLNKRPKIISVAIHVEHS